MSDKWIYEEFGNLLIQSRKRLGLTRVEVARRLELSNNAYYQYEKGLRKIPLSHVKKLVILLELNIDEFFRRI